MFRKKKELCIQRTGFPHDFLLKCCIYESQESIKMGANSDSYILAKEKLFEMANLRLM